MCITIWSQQRRMCTTIYATNNDKNGTIAVDITAGEASSINTELHLMVDTVC